MSFKQWAQLSKFVQLCVPPSATFGRISSRPDGSFSVLCGKGRRVEAEGYSPRRYVPFSQGELKMRMLQEVQINPVRVDAGRMSEAEALALLDQLAREMAELVLRWVQAWRRQLHLLLRARRSISKAQTRRLKHRDVRTIFSD